MGARLSAEETEKLLGYAPTKKEKSWSEEKADPYRQIVDAAVPQRLSKEETAAMLSAARAPKPPKVPGWSQKSDLRTGEPKEDPIPKPETESLDPSTEMGATVRGAVQGGTARFADEIGAGYMMYPEALGRLGQKVGVFDKPKPSIEGHFDEESAQAAADKERPSMADTYRGLRDSLRADNKTSQAAHPWKYGLAEGTAGMALPMPGSGLMAGAPLAVKAGIGAAQGAGYGLALGAGGSEAKDFGGVAKDAAENAFLSAPFGVGGGAMSHVSERLAPYFSGKAGEWALQSQGTRAGIKDALAAKNIRPEQISGLGNEMLERGMVPTGLNPFSTPLEGAQKAAKKIQETSGKTIGEVYEGFDKARPIGPLAEGQSHLDPGRIRDASRKPLIGAGPTELDEAALARGVGDKTMQSSDLNPGSAAKLHDEFSKARSGVNWGEKSSLSNTQHRDALRSAQNALKDQVGEQLGAEELAKLNGANRDYYLGTLADDLSTNALRRDAQGKPFKTIREMMSAVAGGGAGSVAAGTGGAVVGLIAPKAVELLMSRGPNVMAHVNDLMSKASKSPEAAEALQRLAAQLGIKVEDLYGDKLRERFSR